MPLRLLLHRTNKYITEKLLESPAFHRFAIYTHKRLTKITEEAIPYIDKSTRSSISFIENFKENIKREIQKSQWPKK
ncbi:11326_t:CDS:2 [Entrophospora sp. SA101]|nr:1731_t:CDS:2 [Entrophospora sp. SA101]CAJ0836259.1 1734_t:CDS:2 [Entrophospora sp. SA101]CAJ0848153.1 11326_t:CDS:2 [Entrophospora sp. SA101]CAJ0908782.1 15243_t:CDS:2 [Entrophospora sp. SA101]CAJ0916700.1 9155_t:CDS:2 [Entrophospora sp. SA101]